MSVRMFRVQGLGLGCRGRNTYDLQLVQYGVLNTIMLLYPFNNPRIISIDIQASMLGL